MVVSLDEKTLRKALLERPNSPSIARAARQQDRIRMHVDTGETVSRMPVFREFLARVQRLIPQDKYETFSNLIGFPLPSTEVTASIFGKLDRIFDGANPSFSYQFRSAGDRDDWEWYRQEVLHEPGVWSSLAWSYFKTEINSVLVVDMPLESAPGTLPEPYFYFVTLDRVLAYGEPDFDGVFTWIAFSNPDGTATVIDGVSYRRFAYKDGILGRRLSENPHGLDFCPARWFWSEYLSPQERNVRKSPLSDVLERLDWYLFSAISKRHFELYGKYPILWGFEEECDYQGEDGSYCDHGLLRGRDGKWVYDMTGKQAVCPKCGKRKVTGAGSFITVPIPSDTQADLHNPVGMLSVDRQALDFNQEELEKQKSAIVASAIGSEGGILDEASVADVQVAAVEETRETVLNRVKKGFEGAQAFVDRTVCLLRYGPSFVSASVNYGTEFYVTTVDDLRKRYREAKEAGEPQSVLDSLLDKILDTEYHHNPILLQRMQLLSHLEPYRHLSRGDVLNLWEKGVADTVTLELKTDFPSYVQRFERENDNITEFGVTLRFSDRVNRISQKLYDYARETVERRGAAAGYHGEGGDPAEA